MKENLRILIADDNADVRESLKDILEDRYKKASVSLAGDGYQAIEKVKKEDFDILFIDIRMPGINGVQTFKEIKKISPKSVAVMITGYSVEELVSEARREGAYAILYKPLDAGKLIEIIDEALEKPMVMVVDDRKEDRQTLSDILESKGYRVAHAENGYQAIELVKKKRFGIIFMDVKMPGIDGVETLLKVMQIDPQVPVAMMTGYQVEDLIDKALTHGACMCLYKPFKIEEVLRVLERAIQSRDSNPGGEEDA